ncbi:hypothetical protein RKD29_002793 [Streptomyces tendae]|uniref:hypothetical protein n=1 Tax=Streptomyces tendae TaxID=1932 RepID=UPI003839CEA8
MSAPVHRTSERPSAAALASARERREEGRTGRSAGSRTSAEQAFLGLQSSAGNQAAAATVQRARGRALERAPGAATTRPGSAPGARRDPAGPTRRGSESGTQGMEADPALREQATAARRAALAAGFRPSDRTRRGSDTDTRPGPAGPTRRGSESGTHGMEADPRFQEELDAAREEARAAAEEARLAAERTAAEEARLAALAARFAPSGRTRRGSDLDTRPEPATLTRRGSDSGTQGMEVDADFQEELDTAREQARAAAERAAEEARRAALAARFTPSGRTRRGSDLDTRPEPATLTRRGSDSGTQGMEVDPRFQEHVDTARDEARRAAEEEARLAEARAAAERARRAAERAAAEEARLTALAARFAPSGRTRRGSESDTRPNPAELTRRGSVSGTQGMGVDPDFQTRLDTARDEARTAATERAAADTEPAAADTRAEVRSDRLKAVAENADQGKRLLDPTDALTKGVQAPTAAGLGQEATAMAANGPKPDTGGGSGAEALKHDASATGVSGASLSAVTELLSFGASVADSFRNLRTALRKGSGAGYHNAHKKGKTKATDAGMSVASTGANAGTIAKEAVKLQGVASTAASAEASGVLSGVAGVAKGIRAAFKTTHALEKIRGLRQLQKANAAQSKRLLRLEAEANTAELNARFAREAVERARNDREGRTEDEWAAGIRAAGAAYEQVALIEARAKADFLGSARDLEDLTFATNLAKSRKVSQAAKEMGGGVMGEGLKGAGGIATVAIVATGALASNPAGWITAAVGAGLVLTTAAYKGGSAAYGRFQEAHHPELYTPEGEPIPTAKDTGDSLLHAMKFWKKITRYKRQLAAHKIYNMVSREGTDPALRASALQLLILIKAGPKDHNLEPDEWERRLMNPAEKADVIKEITDQLASS